MEVITVGDALQVLKDAKEKISSPDRWTKFASARDAKRCLVNPMDPSAVCWCAVGAIEAAIGPIKGEDVDYRWTMSMTHVEDLLERFTDDDKIWGFNDDPNTIYDDIMKVFHQAIEYAEGLNPSNEL